MGWHLKWSWGFLEVRLNMVNRPRLRWCGDEDDRRTPPRLSSPQSAVVTDAGGGSFTVLVSRECDACPPVGGTIEWRLDYSAPPVHDPVAPGPAATPEWFWVLDENHTGQWMLFSNVGARPLRWWERVFVYLGVMDDPTDLDWP
jgi:hypothetical protein